MGRLSLLLQLFLGSSGIAGSHGAEPDGSWRISPARQASSRPHPCRLWLQVHPRWILVLPAHGETGAPAIFLETSGVSPCLTVLGGR